MALKSKPLTEQVALVTGGGTGIGRAFAGALSNAGARVVIASRREETLRRVADELNAKAYGERVFPYAFDVRSRAETKEGRIKVVLPARSAQIVSVLEPRR